MFGVYGSVGQKKASKPEFDLRQFLFFSYVFHELNKRYIETEEQKCYYLYCIVRGP